MAFCQSRRRKTKIRVIIHKLMKRLLAAIIIASPTTAVATVPKQPTLFPPQIVSPTEIRWRFKNNDPRAVAFELWSTISRSKISAVDNPQATYIAETNIVPADPDMACGRYIVAVDKTGKRSFGQKLTYPCVRTPPVPPTPPKVQILDKNIIKVTADSGANDPATSLGIYESQRGVWVSPANMFVANPELLTPGAWGADLGTTLIGLRPNSSYTFLSQAQSVTGETTKFSMSTTFRMPAEKGDPFAPSLARLGEATGLLGQSLIQTFVTKSQRPTIAGIANAKAVTVTLDDRPYLAEITGTGEVKNFSFTPSFKIGAGYHYLRLGAQRDGTVAWSPTIEFRVTR
jgi:hypothetical protein